MVELNEKPAEVPGLNEKLEDKPSRSKLPIIIIGVIGVIAVILLPVLAITYLGILDVDVILPEICTLPFPLNCQDYSINNDNIQLVFINGGGKGMYIKNITAESEAFKPRDAGDGNHNCALTVAERDKQLRNGERRTYTLDVSTENGSKCTYYDTGRTANSYEIKIFYDWADNRNITHTVDGELFAKAPE